MACVISARKTEVENGKLIHNQIGQVWRNYDPSLHKWILHLTEAFDLTFPVPEKNMNIVPCLLPNKEPPNLEWPNIFNNNTTKLIEMKVSYKFTYIPSGLFNRLQVRLYQYGDSAVIWNSGSLLKKNNHQALIVQTKNQSIQIKVQGVKPQNIIFVIHEAIEILIQESFNTINYVFSCSCPVCVDKKVRDPCLFDSALLKRAKEAKAPYLQCNKCFCPISIEEILSFMPLNNFSSSSNIDLYLGYALRDLNQIKRNFKYDLTFWYCSNDNTLNEQISIKPLKLVKKLTKNYSIWYSEKPDEEKIDTITHAIKESKMVILGISDEFSKNETCIQVLNLVKKIIKKNYLIIEFGEMTKQEWRNNPEFVSITSDCRVIMLDPSKYQLKLKEVFDILKREIKSDPENSHNYQPPEVFISYCWANSKDAVCKGTKPTETSLGWLDPRTLVEFFKDNGINAWLDIKEARISISLFQGITSGINSACVFISCLSDEYVQSENCQLEFKLAHISLKMPIIKAIVGTGNEWRKHELSFLSGNYPELDFQYKNEKSEELKNKLLELVKSELKKTKEKSAKNKVDEQKNKEADLKCGAFQELYELTMRKFFKELSIFCKEMATIKPYPKLFSIDLIGTDKISDLKQQQLSREQEIEDEKSSNTNKISSAPTLNESKLPTQDTQDVKLLPCIRPMCEYDEGWHFCDTFLVLNDLNSRFYSYLLRIMSLIKNGNLSNQLQIFLSEQGQKLLSDIESKGPEFEFKDSYIALRENFINEFEKGNVLTTTKEKNIDLERCELKNGKKLWLCKEHIEITNCRVLSDDVYTSSNSSDQPTNSMLEEIENIKTDII